MSFQDPIYEQLIDALRLVASPYEIQRQLLPHFVDLPDEILLAVDPVASNHLARSPEVSPAQAVALSEFNEMFDSHPTGLEHDQMLIELRDGEWFERLRRKAEEVLDAFGEEMRVPTQRGITYVRAEYPGESA